MISYLRHKLATSLIHVGFAMLDPKVREEVLRLMGIAGRKGII